MDGIKIDVTGNIAKVTEKPRRITSGTIGLPVEFTFDDQWDGLSKKAVFRTGHFIIVCDLNEEENTVPWEVLVFPNMWLSIGVYGVNEGGTISIPTIWVNVAVIQPGTVPDGASPAEPTPPVWQRIEDEVNRIGGVVDDVNNKYDGTQENVEKLNDRVSDLEKNGTGGVAPMIVTLDDATGKASHTAAEIFYNFEKYNFSVILGREYIPIVRSSAGVAEFSSYENNQDYVRGVQIFSDGSYVAFQTDVITRVILDDEIGNISSALDKLHAYAQELGGVVVQPDEPPTPEVEVKPPKS